MELEPAVRRIVNVVNKLDRRDETLPWSRRRQEGAAVSRRLRGLVMPPGPKMASETNVPIAVDGRELQPFLHDGAMPDDWRTEREPHHRGEVLVRALMDTVMATWQTRKSHPGGRSSSFQVAEAGARSRAGTAGKG